MLDEKSNEDPEKKDGIKDFFKDVVIPGNKKERRMKNIKHISERRKDSLKKANNPNEEKPPKDEKNDQP